MQMYDQDDPTDNWKTAKRGDPTEQDISLRWWERENAGADEREEKAVDSHHRR